MEINKIYDKSTGTTYDIGGSNKMKLVATGIPYNHKADQFNVEGHIELNKTYLFEFVDVDNDGIFGQTIVVFTTDYQIAKNVSMNNIDGVTKQYNMFFDFSNVTVGSTSVLGKLYSETTLNIYELPFSL